MAESIDGNAETRIKSTLSDADEELAQIASKLQKYLQFKCERLEALGHGDFRYRLVDKLRVKPASSVIRSMREMGAGEADMWVVDDIIGTRVVVVTMSDIDYLAQSIIADTDHDLQDVESVRIVDESGYRATHVKAFHRTSFGTVGCEIQIRTMLQDAWAYVSRADVHKREDLPEILRRVTTIQASQLAATDEALELIRQEAKRLTPPARTEEATEPTPEWLPTDERSAEEQRRTDEEYVLHNPASEGRVQSFLDSFKEDRAKTAILERLLQRTGRFANIEEWNDGVVGGFLVLLRKGPFVESSSWLSFRTWEFAVAAERRLLDQFGNLLHDSTESREVIAVYENWDEILVGINAVHEDLVNREYEPGLIVITGRLQSDILLESHVHLTPKWEMEEELRGSWIIGAYGNLPVLHLRDMTRPGIFVVDSAKFIQMTQYDGYEFSVEEFDDTRAQYLLEQNPNLIRLPAGVDETAEARVRELQLHVGVKLYESVGFSDRDPAAVSKAELRLSS